MDPHSFPAGLYVAATPIGHLADISERVRQALTHCDRIYAEDTRHTQALLSALGISRKKHSLHALHDHNERTVRDDVVNAIANGASVVLVSDAGTPAISDPGYLTVDAVWSAELPVCPLPGPSALTAAVSVSGFARWPLCFWGFAPAKSNARREWLKGVAGHAGVAVLFEAPHRADESLWDCADVFGAQTKMLYARELSKQHETLIRGSIDTVQTTIAEMQQRDPGAAKGELVWVFDLGEPKQRSQNEEELIAWAAALAGEMPAANAAKCLVKRLGVDRNTAYQAVLNARANAAAPNDD